MWEGGASGCESCLCHGKGSADSLGAFSCVGHGASSASPARHWSWDVDEWLSPKLVSCCLQVVSVPESHVVSADAQRTKPPGVTEGGGWTPASQVVVPGTVVPSKSRCACGSELRPRMRL